MLRRFFPINRAEQGITAVTARCAFAKLTGESLVSSQLYDLRMRIEAHIKSSGLDAMEAKGKIGLRSGKLLAFITPTTPDDPAAVAKLKAAAKEVLNLNL